MVYGLLILIIMAAHVVIHEAANVVIQAPVAGQSNKLKFPGTPLNAVQRNAFLLSAHRTAIRSV